MRLIPMVALVPEGDVATLRKIFADDLDHVTTSDRLRQLNGWSDDQMRFGVLVHALLGAYAEGEIELVRLPPDAAALTEPEAS